MFEFERATSGLIGSTGTKYKLITLVLFSNVVLRSANNAASVHFGIKYNLRFTINDDPSFAFTTGVLMVTVPAPLDTGIVVVPFSKLVPTMFLSLTSLRFVSTSLLAELSTVPPPAKLSRTISNTFTGLLL